MGSLSDGNDNWRNLLLFAGVASVGGIAKALFYRKPVTRWFDIVAAAFASGFTGFLVGASALTWLGPQHTDIVLSLAGLAGWVGPSILDWASSTAIGIIRAKAAEKGVHIPGADVTDKKQDRPDDEDDGQIKFN